MSTKSLGDFLWTRPRHLKKRRPKKFAQISWLSFFFCALSRCFQVLLAKEQAMKNFTKKMDEVDAWSFLQLSSWDSPPKIGKLFATLRKGGHFWDQYCTPLPQRGSSPFHWRVQSFLGRWILGNLILALRTLFNLDLFFRWFFPFYHGIHHKFFKKNIWDHILFLGHFFPNIEESQNPSKGESNWLPGELCNFNFYRKPRGILVVGGA